MTFSQKILLLAAGGVTPVGLSYGVDPSLTLDVLYGLSVSGTDQTHIYRGIMGLYLGFCALWLTAALTPAAGLERSALISLVVFMFGIAAGRGLSLLIDGQPHPLFVGYFLIEIVSGLLAMKALKTVSASG